MDDPFRLSPSVEAKLQDMLRMRVFVMTEALNDERVRQHLAQLSEVQVWQQNTQAWTLDQPQFLGHSRVN